MPPPMQVDIPAAILRANANPTALPVWTIMIKNNEIIKRDNNTMTLKGLTRCFLPIIHSFSRKKFIRFLTNKFQNNRANINSFAILASREQNFYIHCHSYLINSYFPTELAVTHIKAHVSLTTK